MAKLLTLVGGGSGGTLSGKCPAIGLIAIVLPPAVYSLLSFLLNIIFLYIFPRPFWTFLYLWLFRGLFFSSFPKKLVFRQKKNDRVFLRVYFRKRLAFLSDTFCDFFYKEYNIFFL